MELDTSPRNVIEDIRFAEGDRAEFGGIAPLLRYCAGLTYGTATTRQEFIAAAVTCGYNAATAGVCWAAGRKVMAELEKEE